MLKQAITLCAAVGLLAVNDLSASAGAIRPAVVFGSGNANGDFTIGTGTGTAGNTVEVGLRGKLRYDASGQPQNIFNRSGNTYSFQATKPGDVQDTRARWNFEWSMNSDATYDPDTAVVNPTPLFGMGLRLLIDTDPSNAVSFQAFDLLYNFTPLGANQYFADNSATQNSDGENPALPSTSSQWVSATDWGNRLATPDPNQYTVSQQSQNMAFGPWGPTTGFDPQAFGEYTFRLEAYENETFTGSPVASTEILIRVVPEPAALILAGVGSLVFMSRRVGRSDEV
ncbi:MAG: PEP-CTERM sorting domain-containing protein [Planctomycetota bacterium]